MIMRPSRYRTMFGVVLGFFIAMIISVLGYVYYRNNQTQITVSEVSDIKQKAIDEYLGAHPTGIIYVAAKELKSGHVLSDGDLLPAEISSAVMPIDAVTNPTQAVGKVIRCDVTASTAITNSLLYDKGEFPDDLRLMEYTVINIPQKLEANQFIDIRIMFPNGLDYIILSKKQVTDIQRATENQKEFLWISVSEEEMLRMSSAIVDASIVEEAYLYVVPYIAPDIQKKAVTTYPSNSEVQTLILQDPNIIKKAITELEERNRLILEDSVNHDRESFGKTKVYTENTEKIVPINTLPAETQNQPNKASDISENGSGIDNRF